MLPCRQTSSILANKLQYLNLDDARSTSKGLRVLCEKVDFHRTGAYHHHNNRFCEPEGFSLTHMMCSRTACALGADLSLDTWGALASFKIAFYPVYKIDR